MPSNFKALAGASGGEPTDANFKNVTLLLHGDGSNGAQNNTFLDSSTNNFTITRNGNTTQGSFSPYGSNWSNYFDGTGDYLTVADNAAFGYGTGDFTIELWLFANATSSQTVVSNLSGVSSTNPHIYIDGTIRYYTAGADRITGATIVAGQWYHIALCRSSGSTKLFINGTQSGATYSDANNYGSSAPLGVGTYWSGGSPVTTSTVNGYLSNVRIVKGMAVYTTTFTPPTAPLTAITNTSLLTCQSNRFRDASTNNFTITRNGDVKVTNFAPFAPSSAYSTTTNGGSAYFDGTGDYISAPYSVANSEWWTQDFTMEMWVYNNTNAVSGSDNVCLQLAHGVPTTTDAYWVFGTNASGQVEFLYYNGSVVRLTGTTAAALTAWNHIAMVYTNSTGNISLYLNGSRVATGTKSGTPQKSSGSTINVGVAQNTYYNGYISNLRILDGTALYSGTTYTVPTTPVTAITNTSLLLNATNAAIFDNSMKNDLETVGNAQISTSVKKFGTGSMAFDGTGDYLVAPDSANLELGSGNFTIEAWVYLPSLPAPGGAYAIVSKWASTQYSYLTQIRNNAGTMQLGFAYSPNASSVTTVYANASITASTWHHCAWVRNGTSFKMFLNGTEVTSGVTISGSIADTAVALNIGRNNDNIEYLIGYLDDVRVTNGAARYTSNFTPPTAAFANK